MIAICLSSSNVLVVAFSLTVSSQMTFQTSRSLENLEAEITDREIGFLEKVFIYYHVIFQTKQRVEAFAVNNGSGIP